MQTPITNPYQSVLPLLPLRAGAIFPHSTQRFPVGRRRSQALFQATEPGSVVVVGVQRDAAVRDPAFHDILPIGTLARVESVDSRAGGGLVVTLRGLERCEIERLTRADPFWLAEASPLVGTDEEATDEARMLAAALLDGIHERLGSAAESKGLPAKSDPPGLVADAVAAALPLRPEEAAEVLITTDLVRRLRLVTRLVGERIETSDLKQKIEAEVRDALGKQQRDAILRQQLRAIQKELGEGEDADEDELAKLRQKLDALELPAEVRTAVDRELRRLDSLQPGQMEHNVSRTWLEWIAALPWNVSAEATVEIDAVAAQLDADHYGLEDVKKRILEHMAVLKLTGGQVGTILCLAGPPGVGKTSLGQSIARATGRPFVRVALGGVRDEAEIRGHRRTYVGSLPGRIIHGLRKAEADNPVFLLDEIDKLAHGGWSGNPEAALLEVLDPEQNDTFTDHYLEQPFDLSKVLFICTANDLSTLSPPLRDRMEIVEVPGYSQEEKRQIARRHLVPEQLERHGLSESELSVTDEALAAIIDGYTREAGVRQLKREITRLCRSLALQVARGGERSLSVDADGLKPLLGRRRFYSDVAERLDKPGVATGLAWTAAGGDILFIETSLMAGKGGLQVTGQLGDVMKESAGAALTYVRSNAQALGVDPDFLKSHDVHIHVPAGAVPKDGPSAGVTIFTALTSLLTGRPVRSDTAMTGECTLRGRVLPVGGIKSKVLAAHRAGLTRLLLPRLSEHELDEVPQGIRDQLDIHLVDDMAQVLDLALTEASARAAA